MAKRKVKAGRPSMGRRGRGDGSRRIVGVSLTPAELARLDELRGHMARAVYLRGRMNGQ
jgi:hypothetical protein